jgi:hypothetical protein
MFRDLLSCSYKALLTGAQEAGGHVPYDQRGYAAAWELNLLPGLPIGAIGDDLGSGAGCELDGKLRAAHSSAALAVNSFGPWREEASNLRIGTVTGFKTIRFETVCPTGLRGTPPHLDLLADGDSPVAIESKCTEWMTPKESTFSSSYDKLKASHGHSPWFHQIASLREQPKRYSFLDAAQLVKHALGLTTLYGTRDVRLVYLYWEPSNAVSWPQCAAHRAEADDLAARVRDSNVMLNPMSYRELWSEWELQQPPSHLAYLWTRYNRIA